MALPMWVSTRKQNGKLETENRKRKMSNCPVFQFRFPVSGFPLLCWLSARLSRSRSDEDDLDRVVAHPVLERLHWSRQLDVGGEIRRKGRRHRRELAHSHVRHLPLHDE